MLKPTFERDREYLWSKFRSPEFDPATGMDYGAIKQGVLELADRMADSPRPLVKAAAFDFVARNMRIETDPRDFFPAFACWDRKDRPLTKMQFRFRDEVLDGMKHKDLYDLLNASGSCHVWIDFDHSTPDWDTIFRLGFPGMLENAAAHRERRRAEGKSTPRTEAFFDGIANTFRSILALIDRLVARAESRSEERCRIEAETLRRLRVGAPQNFYDALMLVYLYFIVGEHIDRLQVRSLGNLDNLLLPFYERDLAEGRFTEAEMRALMDYFLMQWASIDNYWGHPFYLGGTDENGNSRINRMSYLILEEFDKLSIPTPKIQLKIARNTPDEFLEAALRMIRRGNSSLVFVGEESMKQSMVGIGIAEADTANYDLYGCYEFSPGGEHNENNTLCGFLNMLKPFELIFNRGVDRKTGLPVGRKIPELEAFSTFEKFFRFYLSELSWTVRSDMTVVNEFERHLSEINPTNVFSAAVPNSLKVARDAFHDGSFYNNTIFQNVGFGSAVDALCVIREFVYRRRELTLRDLARALDADWEGFEELRGRIMKFGVRYGNGVPEADRVAVRLARFVARSINGKPNARGGIWKADMHSAREFLDAGKRTAATPDGRRSGEEMSKNASPVMGMDISGVTALIRSAIATSSVAVLGDIPLDVMMHPSAVRGEDGIAAWKKLVRVYLENGGTAIHFNIFDASTLRDAQEHPENYRGLQVRVCGWNVRFTEMDRAEQDMYIRRAENI